MHADPAVSATADYDADRPRAGLRGWVRRAASDDAAGRYLLIALAIVLLVVAALLFVIRRPDALPTPSAAIAPSATADGGGAAPPAVDPVELMAIEPNAARRLNAAVPFVTGPIPPARPFQAIATGDDLARATDCLAAAVLYEAGNDPEGEAAVAQVVLNRVRHPAFPKTVCGVVFQGSERTTGCQFTFSCDGALARHPQPAMWAKAQAIALQALAGSVYKPVGLATHYHTDWIVPYWQSSLDKLAAVHTHLFFRWRGRWGTPAAFDGAGGPTEPIVDKLAFLSDVHKDTALLAAIRLDGAVKDLTVRRDGEYLMIALNGRIAPDALPAMAATLCAGQEKCRLLAWNDVRAMPTGRIDPTTAARAAFRYDRDTATPGGMSRWDCGTFKRADPATCQAAPAVAAAIAPVAAEVVAAEPVAIPAATVPAAVETPASEMSLRRRRIDPCRAMRNVEDRVGFCAGR